MRCRTVVTTAETRTAYDGERVKSNALLWASVAGGVQIVSGPGHAIIFNRVMVPFATPMVITRPALPKLSCRALC